MGVSVVIPSTLTIGTLRQSVESAVASAAAADDQSEVILVANGPGPDSAVPRIDSPLFRVVRQKRANAPGARNAGIDTARNDAVIFTDDDCVVPLSWCMDLGRALADEATVAVAAPVDVEVHGPVTAFLRHQRAFDAPAVDLECVRYPIGANFGVRRDRLPAGLRFDDIRFNNASEDSDFGYRIRDAGHAIRWLGEISAVRHSTPDRLDQVTERFERYGRGNARLSRQPGRLREAVPNALAWYRSLCEDTHTDYRTFGEIYSPKMRAALSTCQLAFAATYLIGYLDELSVILGTSLVTVDPTALAEAWHQVDRRMRLDLAGVPDSEWAGLDADFRAIGTRDVGAQRVHYEIGRVLRTHAPAAAEVTPVIDGILQDGEAEAAREVDEVRAKLTASWGSAVAAAGPITSRDVDKMARAAGASFADACEELERASGVSTARAARFP